MVAERNSTRYPRTREKIFERSSAGRRRSGEAIWLRSVLDSLASRVGVLAFTSVNRIALLLRKALSWQFEGLSWVEKVLG